MVPRLLLCPADSVAIDLSFIHGQLCVCGVEQLSSKDDETYHEAIVPFERFEYLEPV